MAMGETLEEFIMREGRTPTLIEYFMLTPPDKGEHWGDPDWPGGQRIEDSRDIGCKECKSLSEIIGAFIGVILIGIAGNLLIIGIPFLLVGVPHPFIIGLLLFIIGGILPSMKNLSMKKDDRRNRSSALDVLEYFKRRVREVKGFEPKINWDRDGKLAEKRLKEYSLEEIKKLIDWYLNSKYFERFGASLSACLATFMINLWGARKASAAAAGVTVAY